MEEIQHILRFRHDPRSLCNQPVAALTERIDAPSRQRKYLFSRPDGKPVFLGGFYKKQSDKIAFIILTKEATAPVSRFHNRIPILIDEANIEDWLGDIDFAFYYVQTDYPSALVFHS